MPTTKKRPRSNGKSKRGGVNYSAPAVDKALDVLELLSRSTQALSLTEVSHALHRTKQELFRVLVCLQERRYIVRNANGAYRLSTKLFEIGSRHSSTQALVSRAMPHMERLAEKLEECCHLSIVVQDHMLVVAHAECSADVMLTVRVGATFALHRRNSGLVALAHLPDSRREEYWTQSGEPKARIKEIESRLTTIADRGYELADSPRSIGVKDCVAPILGCGGILLGVLCVSHVRRTDEPPDRPDIVSSVIEAAHAISAEFGTE